jgi:hypothetical protein
VWLETVVVTAREPSGAGTAPGAAEAALWNNYEQAEYNLAHN